MGDKARATPAKATSPTKAPTIARNLFSRMILAIPIAVTVITVVPASMVVAVMVVTVMPAIMVITTMIIAIPPASCLCLSREDCASEQKSYERSNDNLHGFPSHHIGDNICGGAASSEERYSTPRPDRLEDNQAEIDSIVVWLKRG